MPNNTQMMHDTDNLCAWHLFGRVHAKVELFVKLWVVIVMNIFVYDILTKIKIVFGTDSLAKEREAFLSLYFPLVGFIALKLLDCWFINECWFRTHGMFRDILLHSQSNSSQCLCWIWSRIDTFINHILHPCNISSRRVILIAKSRYNGLHQDLDFLLLVRWYFLCPSIGKCIIVPIVKHNLNVGTDFEVNILISKSKTKIGFCRSVFVFGLAFLCDDGNLHVPMFFISATKVISFP